MDRKDIIKILKSGQILYTYCNLCGKEIEHAQKIGICTDCLKILGDLVEVQKEYNDIANF